ncbi:MAG: ATP-binding protein [Candidatus Marinimicrobia bacterium]|nr:ATP-binding protein [Candidatus Neomarinimicrobiota bacterium]
MKFPKYIPRPKYTEKIKNFLGNGLITILTGQRRVGKSYIIYQLIDDIQSKNPDADIIYINKEEFEYDHIKNYQDLHKYCVNKKKSNFTYLFIDEIQDIHEFEKTLRSFLLHEEWEIVCTGSNANLLSGELATYLSGRYIEIRVFPLNYPEYLNFYHQEHNEKAFYSYLKTGGMPHLSKLPKSNNIIREYLRNVLNTIILKDLVVRYNIRSINFLHDLIRYLADTIGSLLSSKRISDYLKSQKINVSPRLVLEYLNYLESVYFVNRVKRKDIRGRKIFEIGEKVYFEDLGLRYSLIPYQIGNISQCLENIIYQHLRIAGYTVWVGWDKDKEIDFIAEKDNNTLYIQVAYMIIDQNTHEREFGNLLAIPDAHTKIVLSMDKGTQTNYKGVKHFYLPDFLLNLENDSFLI